MPPEMGGMGAAPPQEGEEAPMSETEDMDFGADLMKLFDFEETSEKQKISQTISSNFKGTLDDVGFQRIVSDSTGNEMAISKLDIDEFTSPGEIVFVIERLLEEIKDLRRVPAEAAESKSKSETELYRLKALIESEGMEENDVSDLVTLYHNVFRINRYAVHREAVTLDPEAKGYWRWFDPYFQ
jgi:hypothetical protein